MAVVAMGKLDSVVDIGVVGDIVGDTVVVGDTGVVGDTVGDTVGVVGSDFAPACIFDGPGWR